MAMEHAEGSIEIGASLEDVMDVLEDYEAYPEWAEVTRVEVRQRGEGGRATEVAFEVDIPVLGRAEYTLSYRYAPGDTGLSWVTKDARGAVRDIRGEYLLDEVGPSTTRVTYRLAVEIGVLVPGFVRTEGARRVIENALERLKRRVEMG
jgi:carbon monoxide dehydrogenase subunit G